MKHRLIISFSILLSLFTFSSCIFMGPSIKGNGDVTKENRKTKSFDEIRVSRGMNVYISQGDEQKIVVEADENLLNAIETNVEGNTLKVTTNKNIRKSTVKKVYVTVKNIYAIKASAGSNIYSETILQTNELELGSSAGSNLNLEVEAKELQVSASAGSNIRLEGKSEYFKGKASAGSNIKAEELITKDCEASVSSGANIWVHSNGDFDGHASSGGNVFYYGNPKSINSESSSGGNVIKK